MEINIHKAATSKAMTTLSATVQGLDASINEVSGEKELELIAKINEINKAYTSILTQYSALFLQNIDSTEDSIEALIEKDQSLAEMLANYQK